MLFVVLGMILLNWRNDEPSVGPFGTRFPESWNGGMGLRALGERDHLCNSGQEFVA